MADKKAKEKDPIDIVHQNAIHVETILKEHRCQKLYKKFSINPYKKRMRIMRFYSILFAID